MRGGLLGSGYLSGHRGDVNTAAYVRINTYDWLAAEKEVNNVRELPGTLWFDEMATHRVANQFAERVQIQLQHDFRAVRLHRSDADA